MLKEISFKEKRIKLINSWIEKFKVFVQKIPEINFKLSELGVILDEKETKVKKKLKDVSKCIPVDLKTDQDCVFNFSRPKSIEVCGFFNVGAVTKPSFEVILHVIAPKSCFHERDYMNSRYLVKKSLYLSILTSNLQKSELISELNYDFHNGNQFLPILQVQTKEIKDTIFNIRVIPEENTFKISKFLPDKSNLRTTYINSLFNESITEEIATPIYNSAHQSDLVSLENDRFNSETLKGMKGAAEGLVLLKIWLKQRGFLQGFGNFNEDVLYSFVTYLVKKGKINKHMSSYQVIRNVWTHLGK